MARAYSPYRYRLHSSRTAIVTDGYSGNMPQSLCHGTNAKSMQTLLSERLNGS